MAAVAPLPEWLRAVTTADAIKSAPSSRLDTASILAGVPHGQRDDLLFKLACKFRAADIPQAIAAHLISEAASKCFDPVTGQPDPFPQPLALEKVSRAYRVYPARASGAASLEQEGDSRGSPGPPMIDVINSWELPEPPPREYIVEGLIPEGAVTILYGDGGFGKSLLALYLSTLVALGRAFFGRTSQLRSTLYLDAELDAIEFQRRAYSIARGIGLAGPPVGLRYSRLPGPISDKTVFLAVKEAVERYGITFVVLDSLTIGTYSADARAAPDMIAVIKDLERLGTVLAIDHIVKTQGGANLSQFRTFGSVFKENGARSVVQVVRGPAGGLVLRQTKHNFGALASEPIALGVDFRDRAVSYVLLDADDERLVGIDSHLPAPERVIRVLAEHADGIAPGAIAEELGLEPKTVKNQLTLLRRQGRAEPVGTGSWRVVPTSRSHTAGTRHSEPKERFRI